MQRCLRRFTHCADKQAHTYESQHIPFNFFAPLRSNDMLAKHVIETAFKIPCKSPFYIDFEYAPCKETHLNDLTAFDTFIRCKNHHGREIGIGIEVKYTEREYTIGKTEKKNVEDNQSIYWQTSIASGAFADPNNQELATDALRQIWRNHLLGLSMLLRNELSDFYSITVFPNGNLHFHKVIPRYKSLLTAGYRDKFIGCTFEDYINAIEGDDEILRWKQFLHNRYVIIDENL